jgi:hypothetical protein
MGFKLHVPFPIMKQLLVNVPCFLLLLLDSRVHTKILNFIIPRHKQSSFKFFNVRY